MARGKDRKEFITNFLRSLSDTKQVQLQESVKDGVHSLKASIFINKTEVQCHYIDGQRVHKLSLHVSSPYNGDAARQVVAKRSETALVTLCGEVLTALHNHSKINMTSAAISRAIEGKPGDYGYAYALAGLIKKRAFKTESPAELDSWIQTFKLLPTNIELFTRLTANGKAPR